MFQIPVWCESPVAAVKVKAEAEEVEAEAEKVKVEAGPPAIPPEDTSIELYKNAKGVLTLRSQPQAVCFVAKEAMRCFEISLLFLHAYPEPAERAKWAKKSILEAARLLQYEDICKRVRVDGGYSEGLSKLVRYINQFIDPCSSSCICL
jgi:hypothetical protein